MKIYLVIVYDRHLDDTYAAFHTLVDAQKAADEIRNSFTERTWTQVPDAGAWQYRWETGEEGPHLHIEEIELYE